VEQLSYRSEALQATVLPAAGARLHRLRAFGHDLLRAPDDPATHLTDPFFWGAYVMAPWCNRTGAGRTQVGTRWIDVAPNFPDGSAIHGQVYASPWTVGSDGNLSVRGGGDGWPWTYEVSQRLAISGGQLRIELALRNLADDPMPAGLGVHPWFCRPLQVAIHGGRVFRNNLEPQSEPEKVSGPFDLRFIGDVTADLDATWTDLSDPAVELLWPGHVRATMQIETRSRFVVAASPGQLDAIAVEPQSHAPHGLRRLQNREPGALAMLSPGEELTLTVSLRFEALRA
jgi:aldose 1-epimerase